MTTETANYQFKKPEAGSKGWGDDVNGNFDGIDEELKLLQDQLDAGLALPVGGWPSSSMTAAVQTSLGKADTAEQVALKDKISGYVGKKADGSVFPLFSDELMTAALDGSRFRNPYAHASLPIRGALNSYGPLRARDLLWSDDVYGADPIPAMGKTLIHMAGHHPRFFINRAFPRLREIASVSWYLNDTNLVGGSLTPSGSPIATRTAAPFSAGSVDSVGQILPIDISGTVVADSTNNMSVLVTYKGGYQETATFSWYAKTSLASATSLLASTPGTVVSVGPNAYSLPSDSTSRGSQLVLSADAGEVVWVGKNNFFGTDGVTNTDSSFTSASATFVTGDTGKLITGPGIQPNTTVTFVNSTTVTLSKPTTATASSVAFTLHRSATVTFTGSKLTFRGSHTMVGSWNVRGDDYRWEDGGYQPRLTFTLPQYLSAGQQPIMSIDGVSWNGTTGVKAKRTCIWGAHLRCAPSDMFFLCRAEDVHLRGCTSQRGWDMYNGPVHYDGLQNAGLVEASGNLLDSEGDAVALLIENCDFDSNCIIKPDLGPGGAITMENTTWHDSLRTGMQLWNHPITTGDANVIPQVKFINCRSWGHSATNYDNDVTGGKTPIPVIDRTGTMVNAPKPSITDVDPTPADYGRARPIRLGDVRTNVGTGTLWSTNYPGVRGIGNVAVCIVRSSDPTKTTATPTGWTLYKDSGVGDGVSPRFWVFWMKHTGTVTAPTASFSGSTTWRAFTFFVQGVNNTSPFEDGQTNNAGAGVTQVTTPSAKSRRRGRMFIHMASIAGTAAQGDWQLPVNMSTQAAETATSQAGNSGGGSLRLTQATVCDIVAFWPNPQDVPSGAQTMQFTNSEAGNGSGLTLVFAPAEEPGPREVTLRDVLARNIISAPAVPLKSTDLEGQIAELYKLATTVSGSAIPPSTVDAKGDLLVGTADNTVGRLAVGVNGYGIEADSGVTAGMKWSRRRGGLVTVASELVLGDGVTGTTTETALIAYTLAASSVVAGETYRITLYGNMDNSAANNCNIRLRIGTATGGTSLVVKGMTNASGQTNKNFRVEIMLHFRAPGDYSAVPMMASLFMLSQTNTTVYSIDMSTVSPVTADLSTAKDITLTGKWTTADATSILRVEGGAIELVK